MWAIFHPVSQCLVLVIMDVTKFRPSDKDNETLLANNKVLMARVITKHVPGLEHLSPLIPNTRHAHSDSMSKWLRCDSAPGYGCINTFCIYAALLCGTYIVYVYVQRFAIKV